VVFFYLDVIWFVDLISCLVFGYGD